MGFTGSGRATVRSPAAAGNGGSAYRSADSVKRQLRLQNHNSKNIRKKKRRGALVACLMMILVCIMLIVTFMLSSRLADSEEAIASGTPPKENSARVPVKTQDRQRQKNRLRSAANTDDAKSVGASSSSDKGAASQKKKIQSEFELVFACAQGQRYSLRKTLGLWEERDEEDGEVRFTFDEIGRKTTKRGNLMVTLYDSHRRMLLRINPQGGVHFKYGSPEDGKTSTGFTHLCSGEWEDPDAAVESPNQMPPPPQIDDETAAPIVVLLASYRDPLCPNTLREMFAHAKYPDRIYAGVVQQNQDGDPDCLDTWCEIDPDGCRRDRVDMMRIPLELARGVMPARYRQELLIKDEHEFCLQIDSHSSFEDDWDMVAIKDWALTGNEMAVMSTYPNRADDKHKQYASPARCSTKWAGGIVHGGNSALNVHNGKPKPYLVPFFGAGVSFSKCHFHRNVPYDPYMPFLFGGEEFNRAVRGFTWGYDVYAPKTNFVYHYYDEDKKPAYTQKLGPRQRSFGNAPRVRRTLENGSDERWKIILGIGNPARKPAHNFKPDYTDLELYGLGNRRSLVAYEAFSGVDLVEKKATSRCNKLGKMKWVPYEHEGESFVPRGCKPSATCKCPTPLEVSKVHSAKMLELTNDALFESLEGHSTPLEGEAKAKEIAAWPASKPVISPLAKEVCGI